MHLWQKKDEDDLLSFCLLQATKADQDQVRRAFAQLDHIFVAAHNGTFSLKDAATIDVKRIARSITTARCPKFQDVTRVIPVSARWLNGDIPAEPWMTEEEHRTAVIDHRVVRWNWLARCLEGRLWRKRYPRSDVNDCELERNLAPLKDRLRDLNSALWQCADGSFWQMIPPVSRNAYFGQIAEHFRVSVQESILLYLHAAIGGNSAFIDTMTPLLQLMSSCIPLAGKKDDPSTWIILTA